ncbi:MAG: hypothetical protein ACREVG_14500 [Burkholderiales bacterium]
MTRPLAFLAALLATGSVQAQLECRADPQDPGLEFAAQTGGRTLEFRGKRPDRELGRSCVLTLDCTLRGSPKVIDYLILPQRAGDPPAVWNIRRVVFRFEEGGEQSCAVTATSDPRPPLAEPPPFIRRPKKN